mgnify:CR=1 FL=1
MSWLDIEKARMMAGGQSYREQYLNEMKQIIDDAFSNASDAQIILAESATPNIFNEIEARVIAKVNNTAIVTDTIRKLIFRDPYYSVNLGDVFQFEGKTWITTSTHTNTIPKSCVVEWFNNSAKFYDNEGNFYDIPCNIKSRLRDLERDGYLRIPNNRMELTIKYDPLIASKIRFTSDWTRMLFNGQAYHVEAIDTVTNVQADGKGFMVVYLASDQIGPYDDVVNNIADRYKPRNIDIQILNGSQLEIDVGNTIQLNIIVTQNNIEVSNPHLVFSTSDETIVNVNSDGLVSTLKTGTATITVSYNGTSTSVEINVVDVVNDLYSIVIEGSDYIYIGREQTYVGKVMNNGDQVFDKTINWVLTNTSGGSTTLASIVPDENSVKVIANDSEQYGTVVLWGILSNDNNVYSQKQIRIKSII